MRYVTQYGELYRLSERNYLRMLRDGRNDAIQVWEHYGAKKIAVNVDNVTDWEQREWENALKLERPNEVQE